MDVTLTVGVDEVGWGALAGPLFTAAVCIPPEHRAWVAAQGFQDSKQLSPAKRQRLAELAQANPDKLFWAYGVLDAAPFDELGPMAAWNHTMRAAVRLLHHQLGAEPHDQLRVVVDGGRTIAGLEPAVFLQTAIPQADASVLECAVASVLAKHKRDTLMRVWGDVYDQYGFRSHKGYGTKLHWAALVAMGPLTMPHYLHRMSYLTGKPAQATLAKHNRGVVPFWALRRPT